MRDLILIVENNHTDQRLMVGAVDRLGSIVCVGTLAEAVDFLRVRQAGVALVVLDLLLPDCVNPLETLAAAGTHTMVR